MKKDIQTRLRKENGTQGFNSSKGHRWLSQDSDSILYAKWHSVYLGKIETTNDESLPQFTISIVTHNSEKWLERFLISLTHINYPKHKISLHFIDNRSTDQSVDMINAFMARKRDHYRGVKLFQQSNLGYGAGNDIGINASDDDFVLVVNVDTEFDSDSIRRAMIVATHDKNNVASWEFRQIPYEHPKYYDPVTLLTNWSSHACILIRRSAYEAVGGYEKAIFMYGEDVELSYRLRQKGWKLRYLPKAQIKHNIDLDSQEARPNIIPGSISSNLLLRYRYGCILDIIIGELRLARTMKRVKNTDQKHLWENARAIVRRNRFIFLKTRKIFSKERFLFRKFEFEYHRKGYDTKHFINDDITACDPPLVSMIFHMAEKMPSDFQRVLATALGQTYYNIEYVFFDHGQGAHKAFIERLSKLYDRNIRYVLASDKPDKTAPKGEFLYWVDGETLMFSDHIETLVKGFQKQSSAFGVKTLQMAFGQQSKIGDKSPEEWKNLLYKRSIFLDDKEKRLNLPFNILHDHLKDHIPHDSIVTIEKETTLNRLSKKN